MSTAIVFHQELPLTPEPLKPASYPLKDFSTSASPRSSCAWGRTDPARAALEEPCDRKGGADTLAPLRCCQLGGIKPSGAWRRNHVCFYCKEHFLLVITVGVFLISSFY